MKTTTKNQTQELQNPFLFQYSIWEPPFDVRFLLSEIEFGGPECIVAALDIIIFDFISQNISACEEIDTIQITSIMTLKRLRDAIMSGAGMPNLTRLDKWDEEKTAQELARHIKDFLPVTPYKTTSN